MSDVSECVVKQRERAVAVSVRGKNRSRPVLDTKQEKRNTLYNFFFITYLVKNNVMNAQVRFYISSSPSPSTSHQSASPSRVTSPENGVSSRTRVQRIVTRVGLESESRTRVLHHWFSVK